jgi:hypothetical protein
VQPNITVVYPFKDDKVDYAGVQKILLESGIGLPPYTQWGRSRSGCYFCFFQKPIEWVRLFETHPDLFALAEAYEDKSGEIVAPTWAEINRIGKAVRRCRRENGLLEGSDIQMRVVDDLKWTAGQRRDFAEYKSGQVITLVQTLKGIGLRGSSFTVTVADRNGVHVLGENGGEKILPFRKANRWSVGEERVISLAKGDEILIRANHPKSGLRNGDVDIISHVSPDAIVLKSGRIFSPRDFKQFSHGYFAEGRKVPRGSGSSAL